jgi:hypothetical protein
MQIELKTYQRASILLGALSAAHTRLENKLVSENLTPFEKHEVQNELDVINGLYVDVWNASSINKIGG